MQQVLRMAAVSGRGNHLFADRMGDVFHRNLGQAPSPGYALYQQAKADVAQWNQIIQLLATVANQTVRDQLVSQYGLNDPTNQDKGQYTAIGVQTNINTAEGYTPVNYMVFTAGDVKNRVARLENFMSSFRSDVKDALAQYGPLPQPVVITQLVGGGTAMPDWVLPVGVGLVGIAALGAFGVIKIF